MYIKNISLKNFRNYENAQIEFINGKNIIYGKNGQGKTNIIEAIYFMQSGKSYRSFKDKETVKFGKDHAVINAEFIKSDRKNTIAIKITPT